MKKILLGLFLTILFFFAIHKNQAVGYVIAQQGQGGAILQQEAQVLKNAVVQTQEEKDQAEAKKKLEELKKQKQTCDQLGEKCCVGQKQTDTPLPGENLVGESISTSDELTPVWCEQSIRKARFDTRLMPSTLDPNNCHCIDAGTNLEKICGRVSSTEQGACGKCSKHDGIWTALGCVDSTLADFIKNTLLGWGIGLAGILAMFCIIYSAFVLQTSSGNPEKIKKAKERLTACIVGLLLIIFSVFMLKLVGVDILQIPGFG